MSHAELGAFGDRLWRQSRTARWAVELPLLLSAMVDTAAVLTGLNVTCRMSGSGELCRRLLAGLPDWFADLDAIDRYAATAEGGPAVIAVLGEREVGILTLVTHTAVAAEIDVMAVAPEYHRQGIGRGMLDGAERMLEQDGIELLQVKTLSESVDYEPYARTRALYESCGFRALQELPDLWGPENPAVQLVKCLGG